MAIVDGLSSVYGGRLNIEQTITKNLLSEGRNYAQRKRAGTVMVSALVTATLASMMQAFFAVPDSTRPRNKSQARTARAQLEKRIASLLDQLLRMDGGNVKRNHVSALYAVVDEMLLKKLGGEVEEQVRPFVKKYVESAANQDLVTLLERLKQLADANLFEILDSEKYNGREAQEAVGAMKAAVLRQMALRGIVTPLEVFSGCLSQAVLDNTDLVKSWGRRRYHVKRRRNSTKRSDQEKGEVTQAWGREIASAWYTLHHCMCIADRGGAEPIEYLQAGLTQLTEQQLKMLAVVVYADGERAEYVPLHARWARHFLGQAVAETAQLSTINGTGGLLDLHTLRVALAQCIEAHLTRLVDDGTRKLDKGCRPGVRTGEVANFVWRSFRQGIDKTGAIYVYASHEDVAQGRTLDMTLDLEAEKHFAQALTSLASRSLQLICLKALDNDRLCAVAAMRSKWDEKQQQVLAPLVDQACQIRYQHLQAAVTAALEVLQGSVSAEGRDMLPQRLLELSDALASRDHFAAMTMPTQPQADDSALDQVISSAVACLQVPDSAHGSAGNEGLSLTSMSIPRQPSSSEQSSSLAQTPSLEQALSLAQILPLEQASSLKQTLSLAQTPFLEQTSSLRQASFLGQKSLQILSDTRFGELLHAYRGKLPRLRLQLAAVEREVARRVAPFDKKVMGQQQHLLGQIILMGKKGQVAQRSYQVKFILAPMVVALVALTVAEVARQDQIIKLGASLRQTETPPWQVIDSVAVA